MNWLVQKLAGAVLAGVGFKLGSDVYDAVKAKLKETRDSQGEREVEEAGAALTETEAAEQDAEVEERRRRQEGEDA